MIRAAAAERNGEPILQVLREYVKAGAFVLEVASGPGQHVAHFAPQLPQATFQPSDVDRRCLRSIDAYRVLMVVAQHSSAVATQEHLGLANVRKALLLDVAQPVTGECRAGLLADGVDVLLNSNMIHISSNAAVSGLFAAAGRLLRAPDGLLFLYGPFSVDGQISPASNVNFDASLRSQNAEWGLRDTVFLKALAADNGLRFDKMHDMPANNKVIIFRKCT